MLFDRNKLLTDYVPIVLQSEKTYSVKVPTIMNYPKPRKLIMDINIYIAT